ncbi:MAG: hypothetical protein Q7S46_09390, partial [Gallionella sp.]|nr:hypothetical protein [Gallionella sp.]
MNQNKYQTNQLQPIRKQLVAHPIFGFAFRFPSPVRRRVAEAGQEMSARTDETTSHSTKLANDASQVAGYV